MMKKRVLALVLLLCMALTLVACASKPYKKVDFSSHINFGTLNYKNISITQEEYQEYLESARKEIVEKMLDDGVLSLNALNYTDKAQSGDIVSVVYMGLTAIDGLSGTVEVTVGTDTPGMHTGFDDAVKDIAKDAEKTFQLTFPTDYETESLRGKRVWFTVVATDLVCTHTDLENAHTTAQEGDKVTVTYVGREEYVVTETVDTSAFPTTITVGGNPSDWSDFLPENFDQQLIGIAVSGEQATQTFQNSYPSTHANAAVAGKVVTFTITVTGVTCPDGQTQGIPTHEENHDKVQINDTVTFTFDSVTIQTAPASVTLEKDITLGVAAPDLPAGFDTALLGVQKSAGKYVVLTYPTDFEDESLAGKEIMFSITVSQIARPGYHAIHSGDKVVLDYVGDIVEVQTIPETTKENVVLNGDLSEFPLEFADALIGKKQGDIIKKDLLFSSEHADESLKGKKFSFVIEVVSIAGDPAPEEIAEGSTVTVKYSAERVAVTEGGEKKLNVTDGEVDLANLTLPAEFAAQIEGLHLGETKTFRFVYPDDSSYGELAAKTVRFTVKAKKIVTTTYKDVANDAATVVQFGDRTNIDYVGVMVGETTPFANGSATGQSLEIGSNSFIDGFEEALIGAPLGVEIPIYLTFPTPYASDPTKSGKDVVFYVTVNSLERLPAGTIGEDRKTILKLDWINSATGRTQEAGNLYPDVQTWENEVSRACLEEKAQEKLMAAAVVLSYPKDEVSDYAKNLVEMYEMYAAQMGYTLAGYVSLMGYTEVTEFYDYAISYAQSQVKNEMALLLIAEQENITVSDKEFDAYVQANYEVNGYKSARQFKRKAGKQAIEVVIRCEKVIKQLGEWASAYNNIPLA